MTSAIFPKAKEQLLQAGINMSSGDIRAMLVLSSYTYDSTDEFLADLGAVDNGRSAALAGKAFTNGIFDANDTSITATASTASNALILFLHTGSDATARLIAYIDSAVGLPFTPEASQVCPVVWDNGANKIFAL
jgi:hypothetical protein